MKTAAGLAMIVVALVAAAGGAAAQSAAESGYGAYLDPETGKLGPPPPGAAPLSSLSRTTSPPRVEEPGRTAAGGVMLDLGESLMYSHKAHVGEHGELEVECEQQQE